MAIKVYVRQKGDRRDLLLYYLDPFTKREVSKTAGTSDKRDAERKAADWERELLEYRGPTNDGWQFFRDRIRVEHLATLSANGASAYTTALQHFERLMAPTRLSDITAATLSQFQAKLFQEGRVIASVNSYLGYMRGALNWAENMGIIAKAPKFKSPKVARRVFMRGRPITDEEFADMLKACDSLLRSGAAPWKRFLELLWHSGLRLDEGRRLSWTDPPILVNLDAKPYPQILYYAEGHKARRDDVVPITPELAAWLEKTPRKDRHGLVAPIPEFWQGSRVSAQITEFGEEAEIVVNERGKFASAHDLRRSFGTRWAQKVMPMTLQKLMRHADIATTLRYYVGLGANDAGREIWGLKETPVVPKNVPKTTRKRRNAG